MTTHTLELATTSSWWHSTCRPHKGSFVHRL